MTENPNSKEKPTIIIVDGKSIDKMRSENLFKFDYELLTKFLTNNLKNFELYYFNDKFTNEQFLFVFRNLGYTVNVSAHSSYAVGPEIATLLKDVENKSDNFIIVGAVITGYGEKTQSIAKNIKKNVTVYSFHSHVNKSFIGHHVQYIDLNNLMNEAGIRKLAEPNHTLKNPPPVTSMDTTLHLPTSVPEILEKTTIIIVDGPGLKKIATELNIEIDFNKLKKNISKDLTSFELKYFDTTSADKIFTKKLEKLGYIVNTNSNKKSDVEFLIQTQLAHAVSRYSSIAIFGEVNQDYLHALLDTSGMAKKITHLYSNHNFICKADSLASMNFHHLKDEVDKIKVTQDAILFFDGENFRKAIQKMGIEVDYKKLLNFLLKGRNLVEARYYLRMPLSNKSMELKKKLESLGYTVVLGPANGNDTDPTMICDIQRISQTNIANNYILGAGDNSYCDPLAIPCVENSWRCEVFALPESMSAYYKNIPGFSHINPEDFKKIISVDPDLPIPNNSDIKEENMETKDNTTTPEKAIPETLSDTQIFLNLMNKMLLDGTLSNANFTITQNNREIIVNLNSKEKTT